MTQREMEKLNWDYIEKYIYRCRETGKYHFVDEVEMLDEQPYDTLEACKAALKDYAKTL